MAQSELNTTEQSALYRKRIPIFTRSVQGKYRTIKTGILILAYSVFFLLPWVPWSRHSAAPQALLLDLASRRLFLFDLVVYPQDIIWLSFLLFIAALLLFSVTGVIGRVWCGYFCFQTIWMDAFMLIEHWVQGERNARIKLAQQAWNLEKIVKIGGSHFLMLSLAFITAFSFVAYFTYAPSLLHQFFTLQANPLAYFTVGILTLTTYVAGGLAREQICTYICPYARFQGVMYDQDTLAPAYDFKRGEGTEGRLKPSNKLKTQAARQTQGHGDCIDCGFCVQVCPTGVDIRNGFQYQCVSCGLCIDACNNIMDSLGWKRGLIRYDSEYNLNHTEAPRSIRQLLLRPKVIGYLLVTTGMVGMLFYSVLSRSSYESHVEQLRQPLYVTLSNGYVRNRYNISITNKTEAPQHYHIQVQNIPATAVHWGTLGSTVSIDAGKVLNIPVKVDLNPETAARTSTFQIVIAPAENPSKQRSIRVGFNAPAK